MDTRRWSIRCRPWPSHQRRRRCPRKARVATNGGFQNWWFTYSLISTYRLHTHTQYNQEWRVNLENGQKRGSVDREKSRKWKNWRKLELVPHQIGLSSPECRGRCRPTCACPCRNGSDASCSCAPWSLSDPSETKENIIATVWVLLLLQVNGCSVM